MKARRARMGAGARKNRTRGFGMFISKRHLPRRTVLRGLGATVALPLLDGMVPALTAIGQTAAAPVRRFGVFYVPNGMSMPYWFPRAEGPMDNLPPTLQSLNGMKERVLLCGGLDDEAANLVKGAATTHVPPVRSSPAYRSRSPAAPTSMRPSRWTRSRRASSRRRPRSLRWSSASNPTPWSAIATVVQAAPTRTPSPGARRPRAAHRERPARRVRTALRHERQHRSGGAQGASPS